MAAAALGAPIAFLLTLEEGGRLSLRGSVGILEATVRAAAIRGRLAQTAVPLVLRDPSLDAHADARAAVAAVGAASMMSVPLLGTDGVIGCLCVMDEVPRGWSAADEALLRDIAAWSVGELELRRELAVHRRQEGGLHLLHSLSEGIGRTHDLHSALLVVMEHICHRTGWDHGEAWLPNEDGTRLMHSPTWFSLRSDVEHFATASSAMSFARGEGLPGMVWERGQPLWVHDLSRFPPYLRAGLARDVGLDAAVAIPILARGAVVAVLVFHTSVLEAEDERLTALVATAAAQLGPVLQRKAAEEALRRSESTLAGILYVAADAIVSVDAGQRIRLFNRGAERVFGWTAAEVLGEPLDVLLPERARGEMHRAYVERFMASDSQARWMNERGQIYGRRRDGEVFPAEATISKLGVGESCVCTVVLRDVSERQRAEQALGDARRQLESILAAAGEGIVGVGPDGRATFVNRAAAAMLGYQPREVVGRSLHDLVHHSRADGMPYPAAECPVLEVMRTGEARVVDTDVFWRRDGTSVPVQYTSTPMHDGGAVRGVVLTFSDITERRAVEDALRALAVRDDLTGLHNRRGFVSLAEQQLALSRRSGEPCVLFFFDVDDFKMINDTFGHAVGDQALIEVATTLRDTFRQSDIIGRLGGDEFVALAVSGGDDSAAAIRDRLQRRLAAANARGTLEGILALSIGVARFEGHDERSLAELMADADRALYEYKRQRREMRESARSAIISGGS